MLALPGFPEAYGSHKRIALLASNLPEVTNLPPANPFAVAPLKLLPHLKT